MSQVAAGKICLVTHLQSMYSAEEIKGPAQEMYLRTVTRCKCPVHIALEPVALPTIAELNGQLSQILMELIDWSCDHVATDSTDDCKRLLHFLEHQCLAADPKTILSIIERLTKQFPE